MIKLFIDEKILKSKSTRINEVFYKHFIVILWIDEK